MATLGMIEPEGTAQSCTSRGHALVSVQIHLLVLHCARVPSSVSTQKSLSRMLDRRHVSTLRLYQSMTATR